jgi:hypothetical protein
LSDIDRDCELRPLFSRLREEERSRAASFQAVRSRPGRGGTRRVAPARSAVALAMLAAGIAFLALVVRGRNDDDPERVRRQATTLPAVPSEIPSQAWRAPTDFLLDTPGREWLRSLPTFGANVDWTYPRRDRDRLETVPVDSHRRTS